jgi:hypothetical protein
MAVDALAYYRDGAWEEIAPKPGWRCFIEDQNALLAYTGAAWAALAGERERRLLFTPGGDGVVSIYRIDAARVQNPRTVAISSIASDVITLTTTDAGLFFQDALMKNVSYARIWNISKSPEQPAWVKEQPASNQLKVLDAAALSGWSAGETIQIGDPTSITPNRCIALDISPMLQAVLGRVFRQSGVLGKIAAQASGAVQADAAITENGVSGSFNGVKSFTAGEYNAGQFTAPCSVLSPVSNSNLVFVRESVSGTNMLTASVNVVGVWV